MFNGNPIAFEYKKCSIPIILSDNTGYGYFVDNGKIIGKKSTSIIWRSFFNVAGLIVYATDTMVGIAIVRGGGLIFSLTSEYFSEIFKLSDAKPGSVIVTNASKAIYKDEIMVTMVMNYGNNIIEATATVNIPSVVASTPISLSHPKTDGITSWDREIEEMPTPRRFGFTTMWTTVFGAVEKKILNSLLIEKHKEAIFSGGENTIVAHSDICTLNVMGIDYFVGLSESAVEIFRSENISLIPVATYEFDNELFNTLIERSNFASSMINPIPRCNKNFSKNFEMIRVNNGTMRNFRDIKSIEVQYYATDKIVNMSIGCEMNTDTGFLVFSQTPDIHTKTASTLECEYTLSNGKIMYNTENVLYSYSGSSSNIPITGLTRLRDSSEQVTEVFSIAPYIEYL